MVAKQANTPPPDAPRRARLEFNPTPDYVDSDGVAWWDESVTFDVVADATSSGYLPVRMRRRGRAQWLEMTPQDAGDLAAALAAAAIHCAADRVNPS